MCNGSKKCKSCNRVGRRRKNNNSMKINAKNLTGLAMSGLKGYAGMVIAKKVSEIPFVQGNPIIGIVAPVVVATFLPGGAAMAPVKVGMTIGAASNAINTFAPGLASNLGLTGIGAGGPGSFQIPGVSGLGQRNYNTPMVKVS